MVMGSDAAGLRELMAVKMRGGVDRLARYGFSTLKRFNYEALAAFIHVKLIGLNVGRQEVPYRIHFNTTASLSLIYH